MHLQAEADNTANKSLLLEPTEESPCAKPTLPRECKNIMDKKLLLKLKVADMYKECYGVLLPLWFSHTEQHHGAASPPWKPWEESKQWLLSRVVHLPPQRVCLTVIWVVDIFIWNLLLNKLSLLFCFVNNKSESWEVLKCKYHLQEEVMGTSGSSKCSASPRRCNK